jgi:hypothetical protein
LRPCVSNRPFVRSKRRKDPRGETTPYWSWWRALKALPAPEEDEVIHRTTSTIAPSCRLNYTGQSPSKSVAHLSKSFSFAGTICPNLTAPWI